MAKKTEEVQPEVQPQPEITTNKTSALTYVLAASTGVLLVLVVVLAIQNVRLNNKIEKGKAMIEEARENMEDRRDARADDEDSEEADDAEDIEDADDECPEGTYGPDCEAVNDGVVTTETWRSDAFGYSFEYPGNYDIIGNSDAPDGFLLEYWRVEDPDTIAEYENSMEGYPLIQVMVYDNPDGYDAEEWVDAYPTYSNSDFIVSEKTADGLYGYTWSGLWDGQTWLMPINNGTHMLMITALGRLPDNPVFTDVQVIIDSLSY